LCATVWRNASAIVVAVTLRGAVLLSIGPSS
jgi:hypothetical protein